MKYVKFNSVYGLAHEGYIDDYDLIKFIKHFCKKNGIKYKNIKTPLIDNNNTKYDIEVIDIPFPDGYIIKRYDKGALVSIEYDVEPGYLAKHPNYNVSKIEKWKPL